MGSVRMSLSRRPKEFHIPNRHTEYDRPMLARHYAAILTAMKCNDTNEIGNRQLRLLKSGFEVPITQQHCENILRKYK